MYHFTFATVEYGNVYCVSEEGAPFSRLIAKGTPSVHISSWRCPAMSWKPTLKACEPVTYETKNLPFPCGRRSCRLPAARARKLTPVESSVTAYVPCGKYGWGQKP